MSKSKVKKRKKPQAHQQGGYKKFLKDVELASRKLGGRNVLNGIPNDYKRAMYRFRFRVAKPIAGNDYVSKEELRHIEDQARFFYKNSGIILDTGALLTSYEQGLSYIYLHFLCKLELKRIKDKNDPEYLRDKETVDMAFENFYGNFLVNYFRMITRMGSPDVKYYGLTIDIANPEENSSGFKLTATVHGVAIQKTQVKISNIPRPAFRMGRPVDDKVFIWLQIDRGILKKHYKGQPEKLDVYIQSHALKRLSQRLDLLNREAVNYVLWENTNDIQSFEYYKGYMLLPVHLHKIKVGYLLAWVVDHKVIFRTFLFITHSSTPEGDRLREASGLCKEEINYWRIDRLSTFVNLDVEAYPLLHELFKKAGMEELFRLKEKQFDVDTMQETNMDDLVEYIKRSKAPVG